MLLNNETDEKYTINKELYNQNQIKYKTFQFDFNSNFKFNL